MSSPQDPSKLPDQPRQPLRFFGFTKKSMIRGEMIEFAVDADGRVTSPELELQAEQIRVIERPVDS